MCYLKTAEFQKKINKHLENIGKYEMVDFISTYNFRIIRQNEWNGEYERDEWNGAYTLHVEVPSSIFKLSEDNNDILQTEFHKYVGDLFPDISEVVWRLDSHLASLSRERTKDICNKLELNYTIPNEIDLSRSKIDQLYNSKQ